jgi:hypothetical protein
MVQNEVVPAAKVEYEDYYSLGLYLDANLSHHDLIA